MLYSMPHNENAIIRGRVLHVGCGTASLPWWIVAEQEVRLDVEAQCNPDIVASITGMGDIGDFSFVFAQHVLEHLYPYDVPVALSEFHRVLEPGGAAYVMVPDLEDVRPTEEIVLESDVGPIAGIDLYYGWRPSLKELPHMAHHTGFVSETLEKALEDAGFKRIWMKRLVDHNLLGIGVKT